MTAPTGRPRQALILAVTALMLCAALVPSTCVSAASTGTVICIVVDDGTQAPIPNATVLLEGNASAFETDDRGMAALPNVTYGAHNLTVVAKGFDLSHAAFTVDQKQVTVRVMMHPAEAQAAVIKGHVYLEWTDATHDASDAVVGFEGVDLVPTGELASLWGSGTVAEYAASVPAGTYHMWAWAYSHRAAHSGAITLAEGEVAEHDFHLEWADMSNSGLAGNVTDYSTGAPVAMARVTALNTATGGSLVTVADTAGFYFFTGPVAGPYTVIALAPGYDPGSNTGTVVWGRATAVDVRLVANATVPPQGHTLLYGIVYGDDVPLADATVITDWMSTYDTDYGGVAGFYAIFDFPADVAHGLIALSMEYSPQSVTVTVPADSSVRQDFYLSRSPWAGSTTLMVHVFADTLPPTPLNGATVNITQVDPGSGDVTYSHTLAIPRFLSSFVIFPFPLGDDYYVSCDLAGYGLVRYEVHHGRERHLPEEPFSVNRTTFDIYLYMNASAPPPQVSAIWGYVYRDYIDPLNALPMASVPITMPTYSLATTSLFGRYEHSVAAGAYSVSAYLPGAYSLVSVDQSTGAWAAGPWTGRVAAGERRHVDFILKPTEKTNATVAGQVRLAGTGAPLPGFVLSLSSGATSFPPATTDPAGLFTFAPVRGGWTWTLDGALPGYAVAGVSWRILPASSTPASGLPLSLAVPVTTVIWVDVTVDVAHVANGTVFGKCYRLPGDLNAVGATAAVSAAGSHLVMDSMVVGEDALYSFDVPAGDYAVTVSLARYAPASAAVAVPAGGTVYLPFYLSPAGAIDPRAGTVNLTFVMAGNGTPLASMAVEVVGVGSFRTDAAGKVQIGLYRTGNYTLICGGVAVTIRPGEGAGDVPYSPTGTLLLKPGQNQTVVIDLYAEPKQAGSKKGPAMATVAAVAAGCLVAGGAAGFLMRRRP